jgi:hypothetical protein
MVYGFWTKPLTWGIFQGLPLIVTATPATAVTFPDTTLIGVLTTCAFAVLQTNTAASAAIER